MSREYTEEELNMLSPEEREAITADKPDIELLKTIAGDEDDTPPGEGEADTSDKGAADATAAAAAATDETAAAAETEDPSDNADVRQVMVEPPEDFEARMKAFAEQKAELRSKLTEGDITLDEYEASKDVIISQEVDLKIAQKEYETAVKTENANDAKEWERQKREFFEMPEAAIYQKNETLFRSLNATVIALAKDPANVMRSGAWVLKEADKQIREAFNLPAAATDTIVPKPSRKPDLTVIPKTLAHLPAADIPQTGSVDEFAHIDRLNGVELEQAVSRLSPAERERYRHSA